MNPLVFENIRIALTSIRSQSLRTFLTIMIIALGIMALVGILTAIDVIKESITSNFTSMGANTFNIRNRGSNMRIGKGGKRPPVYKTISFEEASRFKDEFRFPCKVGISCVGSRISTVKSGSLKTNPNITIFGGDENYLITAGYELSEGRNFSMTEINTGSNVALIGQELKKNLFPKSSPIGKEISVGALKVKVIGLLKEKGSSFGFGGDKIVLLPVLNVRQHFGSNSMSFVINVLADSPATIDATVAEATGFFRKIRKLRTKEPANFELTKSDNLSAMLIDNLSFVTIAATLIAIITLVGAAIGLMNIMLVSVTERTREIGVRKAIGATSITIRNQFLIEAIVICQLGGILGIVLGILMGNGVSMYFDQGFIIPWAWMILAAILCFIVGLLSGLIPAIKAAKLDPIEALRFE
ncbi:MAG TPA: ABC transporter permease [Flavobacteriales bacterium]|nr:ABC transporter permease [Flavobacteriales bacterium]